MHRPVQLHARLQKTSQNLLLPAVKLVIGIISVENLHHIPLHGRQLLLQERWQIHLPHKANPLRILLLCRRQIRLLRNPPDLRFRQMADRKHRPRKLLLTQLTQEIRLILVRVRPFVYTINNITGVFIVISSGGEAGVEKSHTFAAVMPRGDVIGPHLAGDFKEGVELYLPVAEDVRVGRAALFVLGEHVVHHPLAVFFGKVHKVERYPYLSRNQLCHEAVFLPFTVSVEGCGSVRPVLHEHGKNVVAFLLEEVRRHRRVHPAGEPHANLDFTFVHTLQR